jgi:SAM-dependent methyltransferase
MFLFLFSLFVFIFVFVLLLFVQSAISPEHYEYIQKLAWKILKPGGVLLFRDYGKYDMAQLRFEKSSKRQGNRLGEDFYVRGDGTRAKFFTEDELRDIWEKDSLFKRGEIVTHTKLFVNRKTGVEMKRIWLQGKWIKQIV